MVSGAARRSCATMARLHDMLGRSLDIEAARDGAHRLFRILDDHLTEREIEAKQWIVSDLPTVADLACFPYIALAEDGGISLNDYAAIRHWVSSIKHLDGFITMPGIRAAL